MSGKVFLICFCVSATKCYHLYILRLFHDVVGNFQSGQEEITLIVNPEKVTIKNYVDDEPGNHSYIGHCYRNQCCF